MITFSSHLFFSTPINSSTSLSPRKASAMAIKLLLLLALCLSLLSTSLVLAQRDPRLEQCKQKCRQRPELSERQLRQCEQRCEQGKEPGNDKQEEEEEGESNNPYFFSSQRFQSRLRTEEGHIRVLDRFSERSPLLQGLENFRVSLLEANPNAFVIPSHKDAESICFVARGKGTVTFLNEKGHESHDVKQGDIIRDPAGTTTYVINRDSKEKLHVVKLLQPVSIPGRFEDFFAAGGENPESFFRSFSDEILEAAFNTDKERVQRVFGQQQKGAIIRASPEQIRALSGDSGSRWVPRIGAGETEHRPFNLFQDKRPRYENKHGQLFDVDANDFPELQELNINVGYANIKKGAMIAPEYNSKATKIAVVVKGRGYLEMACPHLSRQQERREQEQTQPSYQRVKAQLSPGDTFVVPAGHPIVTVASRDENLEIVCFDINAEGNHKFFLAGKNNILKQLEKEAKELSFGVPAAEVDKLFNAQHETVFLPGPEQRQQEKAFI